MKARVILAVAAGLLALVLPAIASGDASVTIGTTGCGVLDSNGNCVAAPFRDVVTNSATGVEIERTYASGVFNDTGRAVMFNFADSGFRCISDITGARTTDWSETLSASGEATVVCSFTS